MQHECQICGKPAGTTCPVCNAMFYCSNKHLQRHARVLGHADECGRMAQQLGRRKELYRLPFTFAEELTAGVDAGTATMCTFLQHHGLHNRGLWQRACSCSRAQPWGSLAPEAAPPAAALFGIGAQGAETHFTECQSWSEFYACRGLPAGCPAALLLDTPLTLCWGVKWALRSSAVPAHLTLHLLGPQKELDIWPVFAVLADMLVRPGGIASVHLCMIGPDVPEDMHNKQQLLGGGCVRLTFCRSLYHLFFDQEVYHTPDLMFAPNAGLAAYQSWAATLESLPRGVPALFTDYCEEAALRAAAMAAALTGAPLALPVSVNPFRRPASSTGRDNALPSLSNGFMFGLVCQPK